MYLRNAPVSFVKDGERRLVYHTVEADELFDAGWSVEDKVDVSQKAESEPELESGPDTEDELEPEQENDLIDMTKNQLIEYASDNGIAVNPYSNKTDILAACLQFKNG